MRPIGHGMPRDAEERGDALHHGAQFGRRQFGKNWQGDGFIGSSFAVRQAARTISQGAEALLPMQGHRIVNLSADFLLRQVRAQRVAAAIRNANCVLIPDVAAVGSNSLTSRGWGVRSVVSRSAA